MPTVIQTNLPNIIVRKSDISDAIYLSTKRDVVIIVEREHAIELIEAIKKEMDFVECGLLLPEPYKAPKDADFFEIGKEHGFAECLEMTIELNKQ